MKNKQLNSLVKASLICVSVVAISSCGSDGSSASAPGSPSLKSIEVEGIANLRFSWDAVANTNHYQLSVNPDGQSGFTKIGSEIDGSLTSFDLPVPLYDQASAEYILAACNDVGCTDSSAMTPPAATALAAGIGYIKAGGSSAIEGKFGTSVSLSDDGSRMAVSADQLQGPSGDITGGIYVFVKDGTGWSQEGSVIRADNPGEDNFGRSISLSGDGSTLAVGAPAEASTGYGINSTPNDDLRNIYGGGAVYIFTKVGAEWTQQAYIKRAEYTIMTTDALEPLNTQYVQTAVAFGDAVSLSDDGKVLAVGAPYSNAAYTKQTGLVYTYKRTGSTWSETEILLPSDYKANAFFGMSVSLSGDGSTLAIGASESDVTAGGSTFSDAGSVYVFTATSSGWGQQASLKASDASVATYFGKSVSLSEDGNTLAVGSTGESSPSTGVYTSGADDPAVPTFGSASSGAVYIFERNGADWNETAFMKASNTDGGDIFGDSISLSDNGLYLAVGAMNEDSDGVNFNGTQLNASVGRNQGAAYVFKKTGSNWSQAAYVKAPNPDDDDNFGISVSINNTGTLLIGALNEDSDASSIGGQQGNSAAGENKGAAYLY